MPQIKYKTHDTGTYKALSFSIFSDCVPRVGEIVDIDADNELGNPIETHGRVEGVTWLYRPMGLEVEVRLSSLI